MSTISQCKSDLVALSQQTGEATSKLADGDARHESPEKLLATATKVRTLSVSDQHATVLITHDSITPPMKSLLKLTVVPFHKSVLQPEQCSGPENSVETSKTEITSFLSKFYFEMTSESGAEYSYYDAKPKRNPVGVWISALGKRTRSLFSTDGLREGGKATVNDMQMGSFKAELISPASEKQVRRAMPVESFSLIEESASIYEAVTRPYIKSIVSGGSLNWVRNIIEGRKEKERLLLETDDFILNIDTKWRSHPDPHTVPCEEWHGHKATEDLYCLGIMKRDGVASLRDLRKQHVPMLQAMLNEGRATIKDVYGLKEDQIRVFVHYQPQFYHFHVHYTRLFNEIGCQVERGHLVSDIIQNLEMDELYYQKRTITYKLPTSDKLYQCLMSLKGNEKDDNE